MIRELRNNTHSQYGGVSGKGETKDGDKDSNRDDGEIDLTDPTISIQVPDDPFRSAQESIDRSARGIEQSQKVLSDFEEADHQETLDIAKLTAKFVNELSTMVESKSGEYEEISEQLQRIIRVLQAYLGEGDIQDQDKGKGEEKPE